jgi:hypothetical protein
MDHASAQRGDPLERGLHMGDLEIHSEAVSPGPAPRW